MWVGVYGLKVVEAKCHTYCEGERLQNDVYRKYLLNHLPKEYK